MQVVVGEAWARGGAVRVGLDLGAGSARAGLESSHTQRRKKLF